MKSIKSQKELWEEIEGKILELKKLGSYHSNTGIEGVVVELFWASLKSTGKTNQEEGIKYFQLFEINKVEEMIRNAENTDGFTIAAYTRSKLMGFI